MSKNKKRCWQPGCTETDTIKCRVYERDEADGKWKPDIFRYCHDHAKENGFCYCCGELCAGIESYEFTHPGLCDNCFDQIEADMGWDEPLEEEMDY